MRLDKFVAGAASLSRKDATAVIRRGGVTVNGATMKKPELSVKEEDLVTLQGMPLLFRETVWVMLNKPEGYVSSTDDPHAPVVTELLPPEYRKRGLFPVGRLDRNTTGLMLLTDDGQLAHTLLSPRHHVEKVYAFTLTGPLGADAESICAQGVVLGGEAYKPALLTMTADRTAGRIVLTEGKYHEIKRMMHVLGAEVVTLERIRFAGIPLDPALARGQWRELTDSEMALLSKASKQER